jgi:acetyl-CoA carboxylase biotin carboxyl carrier protein
LDLDQLKQILDLVKEHDLAEFEVEHEGLRLRVRKNGSGTFGISVPPPSQPAHVAAVGTAPPAPAVAVAAAAGPAGAQMAETYAADGEIELAIVKSPIVGTFYRSSEPGTAAFVEVGASVKKGDVLCIIEAMKLMNEIDSEYDGEITNIYVENGQPVQYGERLFAIRTR